MAWFPRLVAGLNISPRSSLLTDFRSLHPWAWSTGSSTGFCRRQESLLDLPAAVFAGFAGGSLCRLCRRQSLPAAGVAGGCYRRSLPVVRVAGSKSCWWSLPVVAGSKLPMVWWSVKDITLPACTLEPNCLLKAPTPAYIGLGGHMTTQHSLRCPYKAMQVSHKSLYTKYHHPMPYYRPNLMSSYGLLYSGSPQ